MQCSDHHFIMHLRATGLKKAAAVLFSDEMAGTYISALLCSQRLRQLLHPRRRALSVITFERPSSSATKYILNAAVK